MQIESAEVPFSFGVLPLQQWPRSNYNTQPSLRELGTNRSTKMSEQQKSSELRVLIILILIFSSFSFSVLSSLRKRGDSFSCFDICAQ